MSKSEKHVGKHRDPLDRSRGRLDAPDPEILGLPVHVVKMNNEASEKLKKLQTRVKRIKRGEEK